MDNSQTESSPQEQIVQQQQSPEPPQQQEIIQEPPAENEPTSVVVSNSIPQQPSVITARRHVRTITTAGQITEEEIEPHQQERTSPEEQQYAPPQSVTEEVIQSQEETSNEKPVLQQQVYIEEHPPSRYQTPGPSNEVQYENSPEQSQEHFQPMFMAVPDERRFNQTEDEKKYTIVVETHPATNTFYVRTPEGHIEQMEIQNYETEQNTEDAKAATTYINLEAATTVQHQQYNNFSEPNQLSQPVPCIDPYIISPNRVEDASPPMYRNDPALNAPYIGSASERATQLLYQHEHQQAFTSSTQPNSGVQVATIYGANNGSYQYQVNGSADYFNATGLQVTEDQNFQYSVNTSGNWNPNNATYEGLL